MAARSGQTARPFERHHGQGRLTFVAGQIVWNAVREPGTVYREIIGDHYLAVTLIASLLEDRAPVEIEATAVLVEPAQLG